MTTKTKIPEEARRIIKALVNTPPLEKLEPRAKGARHGNNGPH